MTFEEFKAALRKQGVCPATLHNAELWYREIPARRIAEYLALRDHRKKGALLHRDALTTLSTDR